MRPIDPALVDEVWRETIAYPPGRVEAEARAFLAQQPHVTAFARTATADQDPAVQRAAFGLSFLLFKILERSLGRSFPTVDEERLHAAYELTVARLERATDDVAARLRAGETPDQPTVVAHILAVFYGDGAGAAEYDEGVRVSLGLLLRTLSDALDIGPIES